jgi:hypothetical protein
MNTPVQWQRLRSIIVHVVQVNRELLSTDGHSTGDVRPSVITDSEHFLATQNPNLHMWYLHV